MNDKKNMRKLMETVEQLDEYGAWGGGYGYGGGEPNRDREPKNGKPKGKGNVRTCGNCDGVGHFGDEDSGAESDDEYCIICAGTGKVAMRGGRWCKSCDGYGHHSESDEESGDITDDEWCYPCAGSGVIGPGGIPQYNPDLDGTLSPPMDR